MSAKTKIEWCDATWNPVTGCLHGCEYCYARNIAKRFSCEGQTLDAPVELQRVWLEDGGADLRQNGCHVLRYPVRLLDSGRICPYPFAFAPTLHRYKLDEPQKWKKPRTIFVCSMADLFGEWVPNEWIKAVFDACEKAPQHRYIFLTKNPARYMELEKKGILPNEAEHWGKMWFGTTVPTPEKRFFWSELNTTLVSIEPIMEPFGNWDMEESGFPEWIIIGAETGNRKGKVIPKKEWVDEIARYAQGKGIPVFMKESLRAIMGEDFKQEFPWE